MELKLLTAPEAASYCTISRATFYRMVYTYQIPHIRMRGTIRFIKEDLDKFLISRRITNLKDHDNAMADEE